TVFRAWRVVLRSDDVGAFGRQGRRRRGQRRRDQDPETQDKTSGDVQRSPPIPIWLAGSHAGQALITYACVSFSIVTYICVRSSSMAAREMSRRVRLS